jgi:hypothetical protein
LIVSCAYIGDRGASPALSPSEPAPSANSSADTSPGAAPTLASSPTLAPSPTPTLAPTLTPIPTPPLPSPSSVSGLAASDRFWDQWVETECWFGIDPLPSSLAEIVRDADLVVRGPIVDLYIGEYWRGDAHGPSHGLAYAKVAIEELLKGDPVSREAGFVEVQMGYAPDDLDDLRAKLPAHDHLWFLGYEDPDTRGEFNQSEMVGFVYYAPKDYETVFREINGVVEILAPGPIREVYGKDEFLLTLDGTDFEELVDQVRELTATQSTSYSFARWSPKAERDPNRFAAC